MAKKESVQNKEGKPKRNWAIIKRLEEVKSGNPPANPSDKKPVSFDTMPNEINNLISPFGPALLYRRMPQNVVDALNTFTEKEIKNKEKVGWADYLVGKTSEEISFSVDLLEELDYFFREVFIAFHNFSLKRTNRMLPPNLTLDIDYTSAWIVRSFAGDFNPMHLHTGCDISCIGYLKLPDNIEKEWEEDYKDHYPCKGHTEFYHDKAGVLQTGGFLVRPSVGDFIVFPSDLQHIVYPFTSEGERRSFSMNVSFKGMPTKDSSAEENSFLSGDRVEVV